MNIIYDKKNKKIIGISFTDKKTLKKNLIGHENLIIYTKKMKKGNLISVNIKKLAKTINYNYMYGYDCDSEHINTDVVDDLANLLKLKRNDKKEFIKECLRTIYTRD